ncbi:MAG: GNAT family protein [Oscillospiraceae bacterium]
MITATVSGKHVTLRAIGRSDTSNIVRWRNDESVLRNFVVRTLLTAEQHENWLDTRVNTGRVAQFIVVNNESGQDVGSVFLKAIDRVNGTAEYGVFIGEQAARGMGLGTDACHTLCSYAFDELQLKKVYARVLEGNHPSARVFEKVGFTREAFFREHVLRDGQFLGLIFYGLLKEDFK